MLSIVFDVFGDAHVFGVAFECFWCYFFPNGFLVFFLF